jgi:large subunit ribosomal protein L3
MAISCLLGIKLGQSQVFDDKNERIPVTRVKTGPCLVVSKRKLGNSIRMQMGFGNKKITNKPQLGHLKGAGIKTAPRYLKEVEIQGEDVYQLGQEIKIGDVFKIGDIVKVSGISKGKGFGGVVKRHGFKGGPKTHGQSDRLRAPGAIGSTTTPGRVYKGKRMAGHLGVDRVTIKGLTVVNINSEENFMLIKGLIPGHKNGLVEVYLQDK